MCVCLIWLSDSFFLCSATLCAERWLDRLFEGQHCDYYQPERSDDRKRSKASEFVSNNRRKWFHSSFVWLHFDLHLADAPNPFSSNRSQPQKRFRFQVGFTCTTQCGHGLYNQQSWWLCFAVLFRLPCHWLRLLLRVALVVMLVFVCACCSAVFDGNDLFQRTTSCYCLPHW